MRILPLGNRSCKRGIPVYKFQCIIGQLPQVPLHRFVRTVHRRIQTRIIQIDPIRLLRPRLHHRIARNRKRVRIAGILRFKSTVGRVRNPYPVVPVRLRCRHFSACRTHYTRYDEPNDFAHFNPNYATKLHKKIQNRKSKRIKP